MFAIGIRIKNNSDEQMTSTHRWWDTLEDTMPIFVLLLRDQPVWVLGGGTPGIDTQINVETQRL